MTAARFAKRDRKRGPVRHSLFARALLFLLVGGGCLLGAVAALSALMVDEAEDRLLEERIDVARAVGALVEQHIQTDLNRFASDVREPLCAPFERLEEIRGPIGRQYLSTVFKEGVFVLALDGGTVVSVPGDLSHLRAALDLPDLLKRARDRKGIASSGAVRLGPGDRRVVVVVQPVHSVQGELLGYIGGLLQPATTNLLGAAASVRTVAGLRLQLVDQAGLVVASTARAEVFQSGDHGQVLAEAVRTRTSFRGKCHSCHVRGARHVRQTDVLAFAPLPTLEMGMAVFQPEKEALAPAFSLRSRLIGVVAVVVVFLLFAGLSVRAVVRPVTRLTRAVRDLQSSDRRGPLPTFGKDEVGELSRAIQRMRDRMLDSVDEAHEHRRALREVVDEVQQHLQALEQIAAQWADETTLEGLLLDGLDRMIATLGFEAGGLEATYGTRIWRVQRGLSLDESQLLIACCTGPEPGCSDPFATRSLEGEALPIEHVGRSAVLACMTVPVGVKVSCALMSSRSAPIAEERLRSLLHHLAMAAGGKLLRTIDREQEELRRQYLQRVLTAGESERLRVARGLHDTVAQDLAALRLGLEGLVSGDETLLRVHIAEWEERAASMLVTVREILLDLRLPVLESLGLVPAVRQLLDRFERQYDVRGTLVVDGVETDLGYTAGVTLYRIAQEASQNAVQHGRAEQLFVTISFEDGQVELTVEDDGKGFDFQVYRQRGPQADGRGLGILGMEERTLLLGGTLELTSREGEGTTVCVRVPVPGAGADSTPADREEPT